MKTTSCESPGKTSSPDLWNYGKWSLKAVPVYLIACGCMYVGGYWRYFEISFLDYISVGDILARSFFEVFPVVLVMVEFAVGMFVLFKASPVRRWLKRLEERQRQKLQEQGRQLNRVGKWMERNGVIIMPLIFCLSGLAMIIGVGLSGGDYVDAFVIGVPMILGALVGFALDLFFPSLFGDGIGALVGFMFCFTLSICYLHGGTAAEKLKFDENDRHIVTIIHTTRDVDLAALMPEGFIFAGRMGGYVFVASKKYRSTVALPEWTVNAIEVYVRKAGPAENAIKPQ